MEAVAKSDMGKVRDMNQDYFYVSPPDSKLKLYILADGMGGYQGGEVASKLAVTAVRNYIESNFDSINKEKDEILKLITSSIEYANMVVYEKSKEDENLEGMGTTLEVCLIYNNRVHIGHVGDSRIYRLRGVFIEKLTTDHSYVEKLINDGTITKEEAMHHPKKNMLTKALGCNIFVEPEIITKGFIKDDIILICSDGLTNMIDEDKIYDVIKNNYRNAPDNLINIANDNGGYDNVTAIVIKM